MAPMHISGAVSRAAKPKAGPGPLRVGGRGFARQDAGYPTSKRHHLTHHKLHDCAASITASTVRAPQGHVAGAESPLSLGTIERATRKPMSSALRSGSM